MGRQTALVTGANCGIGLEICRQLLARDVHVLLGSRDLNKGMAAMEKLGSDQVELVELDVTNGQHVHALAERLESGALHLDILVNNAGVAQGRKFTALTEPEEISRLTMETNFWGTWNLCRAVIPHMKQRDYGRVVNVSSGLGTFPIMKTINPGYAISKTAVNALTVILAKDVEDHDVLINAMTPGWVRTRLGGVTAERSVEEGADTAVWLCFLDKGGPRGSFFKDREELPW